jgi:hypothetical protein
MRLRLVLVRDVLEPPQVRGRGAFTRVQDLTLRGEDDGRKGYEGVDVNHLHTLGGLTDAPQHPTSDQLLAVVAADHQHQPVGCIQGLLDEALHALGPEVELLAHHNPVVVVVDIQEAPPNQLEEVEGTRVQFENRHGR